MTRPFRRAPSNPAGAPPCVDPRSVGPRTGRGVRVRALLAATAIALAAAAPFAPPADARDDEDAFARSSDPGRAATEQEIRAAFDHAWILPDERRLPGVPDARQPRDLAARARELARLRFPTPAGAPEDRRTRSFGDLLAGLAAYGDKAGERDAFLARLRKERPALWEACGAELEQLGRTEVVLSDRWKPSKDDDRDGIFAGQAFRPDAAGTAPWSKIDGDPLAQQALVFFACDLDALKEVENDFRLYPRNVGADYEAIHGIAGSLLLGKDADGRPLAAHRMTFTQDLPFPYSDYTCLLHVLHRVMPDGVVVADVHSVSPDFDWLAGQDLLVPVDDADGAFVGLLCARAFGFDLDGVPDGEDNVREAIRSSLGNLKRNAEAAYARHLAAGGRPRTTRGGLPPLTLRGVK